MIDDPRFRLAAVGVVAVLAAVAGYGLWTSSAASGQPGSAAGGPASPVASGPSQAAASSHAAASGLQAVVDRSLLGVLPTAVAGIPLAEDHDAENQALADPDLGANVDRIVTAFVGDSGGRNWAYTAVVDVRPASQTDDFYEDWQDSFNASACEPAGGVSGHATMRVGGRTVNQATCAGGVRTYHVRIGGGGLLVSISDLGDAKFGEQVIAGLRP